MVRNGIGSKTLIVEPTISGHRLYYVRLIVLGALARGQHVMVAVSPGATNTPEWRLHMSQMESEVEVIHSDDLRLSSIAALANQIGADHVVVPDGDKVAVKLGVRRRWSSTASMTALVMRENAQSSFPIVVAVKRILKMALLRSANRVRGVTICLLKSSMWHGESALSVARDPVTLAGDAVNRQVAAAKWDLSVDRYWFGVVGAITDRKNLPMVCRGLSQIKDLPVGLVVAGKIASEVAGRLPGLVSELEEVGVPVLIQNRLLDDIELDSLIEALDCVILAHSNEGSSGIMGKAAVLGTRIVSAGARSLEADCRYIPDLAAWSPLREDALTRSLCHAAHSERPRPIAGLTSDEFVSALL